jgi:hypothetical protein
MINAQQNTRIAGNGLFEQSEICLFELSDSGTVLYCRTNAEEQLNGTSQDAVGRDFFDEVAPFENTEELRPLLKRFVRSNFPSERLTFTCRIKNQIVPAKIMLVRVSEQSGGERGKTTIVDIRKI